MHLVNKHCCYSKLIKRAAVRNCKNWLMINSRCLVLAVPAYILDFHP